MNGEENIKLLHIDLYLLIVLVYILKERFTRYSKSMKLKETKIDKGNINK